MEKEELVLIVDQRVLDIPILENHELLVDLRNQSTILIGPSPEIENNTCYTWVRKSVFERLELAQKMLPPSLQLCLYEGLRTLSLQKQLYETRWNIIRNAYPKWTEAEVYSEVIKLVSPVVTLDGIRNIPPHSTGAAVDVYLVDSITQKPVEMGILAKDWLLDQTGVLSKTDSESISEEAKKNRQTLSTVMQEAGFVNYPTEYWHWSFGDRYWAFIKKQPFAFYDSIDF
jgi:D-alanyl-D-alanine dipeptidase